MNKILPSLFLAGSLLTIPFAANATVERVPTLQLAHMGYHGGHRHHRHIEHYRPRPSGYRPRMGRGRFVCYNTRVVLSCKRWLSARQIPWLPPQS